jgi:transposase
MSEAARLESNVGGDVLYMALELGDRQWKVLFRSGSGRQRERSVAARDIGRLVEEIGLAKARLGLKPNARVVSCYEAGRDGFWLDRALKAAGIESLVVDSSSIEVPRRMRRRKTDRLDLIKLMGLLLRYVGGERKVWSVVRVPDAETEDVRQLSRGIARLKCERNRHIARIKALLVKEGLTSAAVGGRNWAERVARLERWDGSGLGPHLVRELILEGERLALVERQLALLKAERERLVASSPSRIARQTRARVGWARWPRKARLCSRPSCLAGARSPTGASWRARWGSRAHPSTRARATVSRASPRPAMRACARCWSRSPGAG